MSSNGTQPQPVRNQADAGPPTATLEDVDIRSEFACRPRRSPNYQAESEALAVLAQEMATNPRNMLQRLVELAVGLCRAGTAGISILEGDVFRWDALAGVFGPLRNSTMPRSASPCGVTIDQDSTQLMHLPDRCFPALRADPRFVETLLIPFHDHGKPVGTVWVVAHSHARKFDREDERILSSLAQFASAGWQLLKAYEAAAESNRNKDEFIAVLGHELRNPIASIRLIADTLAHRALDEAKHKTIVAMLDRQTTSITRIVDDLRDLSRLAHRKVSIECEQLDLADLLREAVEECGERMTNSSTLAFGVETPASPLSVFSDRLRLKQIFDNLLSNAIKFTEQGGTITVRLKMNDTSAIVEIIDTGRGFDAATKEKIFEPFEQLTQPGVRDRGGLGLGLAISRQLIELLGGTITARSKGLGHGATFAVVLPRA